MSESVTDTQALLEAVILEANPTADIGPGSVLSELLTKLAATLQNPIKNDIITLNSANAVSTALASATDTYDPIIDGVASNYDTVRNQGQASTGVVKIIVANNATYYINAGFSLTQPVLNTTYTTSVAYVVKATPVLPTDIQLNIVGNQYYFLLPITATAVGSGYQVSDQAGFNLTIPNSIPNFVSATAYGNFTTGFPIETDKQLIARFQSTLTNKTLLNTNSIKARLLQLYPSLQDVSVIGSNAPEMTRSLHNVFGISTLGMVDVYVRTALGSETQTITKTATLSNGVWSFSLSNQDVAGFYRVVSIVPVSSTLAGSILHTDVYNFSTVGISPSNMITTIQEGRFTTYQTCNVTFTYTLPGGGTTMPVSVLLAAQPNIQGIQNLFLSNSERIACADYLVKAAVPCYVSVAVTLHKTNALSVISTASVQQDIFNYINSLKFGQTLNVSEIIKICHNYDISRVELPVIVNGQILAQDSSIISISATDELEIPTLLPQGVTPNTTIFISDFFQTSASSATTQSTLSNAISVTVI